MLAPFHWTDTLVGIRKNGARRDALLRVRRPYYKYKGRKVLSFNFASFVFLCVLCVVVLLHQQTHRILDEVAEGHHILSAFSSIAHAVIHADGDLHTLSNAQCAIRQHNRGLAR
jgi:hypothetical protein